MGAWAAAAAAVIGAVQNRNSSRRAERAQRQGQEGALDAASQATEQARSDAIPLFQDAQQNALQGFEAALGLQGQVSPAQINAFQQGNQNAQNTLLAGMPQFQNAILGNQVDLSGLQQSPINIDQSIFNQQVPDFTSIQESLNPQQPTTPQPQQTPFAGIPNLPPSFPNGTFLGGVGGNGILPGQNNLSNFLGGRR